MAHRLLVAATGLGLALAFARAEAGAQAFGLDVGAGIATPTGGFGESRGPGPVVQVGVTQAGWRHFRWRAQAEGAWMPGSGPTPTLGGWRRGDARVLTGLLGFSLGPRGGAGGYFLFGIARHWMSIEGTRNPYKVQLGTRVGAGVRWRARGLLARIEVAPHAILSDYGTTEYTPGVFWTTTAGLTF